MSTTTTLEPLTGVRAVLSTITGEGLSDADRLVLIGALEELKAVTAAAQVRVTEAFDTSQRCAHVQVGGDPGKASRSIGSQLALVLRCSPSRGDAFRHLATVLTDQMPHTLHALTQGTISQYHAQVAVTATSGLPVGVREHVDEVLAPDLPSLTPKQLGAACRRVAAQVDAAGVVAKSTRPSGPVGSRCGLRRMGWRTCPCWVPSRRWSGRMRRYAVTRNRSLVGKTPPRVRVGVAWGR